MKHYIALSLLMVSTTPLVGQASKAEAAPLLEFVEQHRDALAMYILRSQKVKTSRFKNKKKPEKAPKPAEAKPVQQKSTLPQEKSTPPQATVSAGPTPEELAFETVRDAAYGGYVPAQDILAYCYATGTGIAADARLAFSWYLKAALEGSKSALDSLIACFENGIGVVKDSKIAQMLGELLVGKEE